MKKYLISILLASCFVQAQNSLSEVLSIEDSKNFVSNIAHSLNQSDKIIKEGYYYEYELSHQMNWEGDLLIYTKKLVGRENGKDKGFNQTYLAKNAELDIQIQYKFDVKKIYVNDKEVYCDDCISLEVIKAEVKGNYPNVNSGLEDLNNKPRLSDILLAFGLGITNNPEDIRIDNKQILLALKIIKEQMNGNWFKDSETQFRGVYRKPLGLFLEDINIEKLNSDNELVDYNSEIKNLKK